MLARAARQDFALVDPHLDADAAVGGLRLGKAVVDVGAQRLQRDGALVVCLLYTSVYLAIRLYYTSIIWALP